MTKQTTDHSGKPVREEICDLEVIRTCLRNAPEGLNKKQVAEILDCLKSTEDWNVRDNVPWEYEDCDGSFTMLPKSNLELLTQYVENNPGLPVTLQVLRGELIFTIDHSVWRNIKEEIMYMWLAAPAESNLNSSSTTPEQINNCDYLRSIYGEQT